MSKNSGLKLSTLKIPEGMNAIIGLIAIFIVMTFLSPHFLTVGNIQNILIQSAVTALLASGITVVIISGGIDLSVGTVMTFASCLFGVFFLNFGIGIGLSIILALISGASLGLINGLIISKSDVPPFIVTLGMMGIAQGLALIFTSGYSLYGFPMGFLFLAEGVLFGIPIPVILVIIVYSLIYVLLDKTSLGRYIYAIGGNEEAAALAGIKIVSVKIRIYILSSFTASIAGILFAARNASALPSLGQGYELDAIAAAVIGGTSFSGGVGHIWGTVIGAVIMGTIKNSLNLMNVSPFIQRIAIGVIIILAVFVDSYNTKRKEEK